MSSAATHSTVRTRSLRGRITRTVTLLIVSLILIYGISVGWTLDRTIRGELESIHADAARSALERIESRLQYLKETGRRFADNPLVINSLVDTTGRGSYLPKLVESLERSHDVLSARVVDFSGDTIGGSLVLPVDRALEVVTRDVGEIYVSDQQAVVIEPIRYFATAQGAIEMQIDLAAVCREALMDYSVGVQVAVDAQPLLGLNNDFEEESIAARVHADSDGFELCSALGLSLELDIPRDRISAPLRRILLQLVSCSALVIAICLAFCPYWASRLTRPILELCDRVSRGENVGVLGTDDELEDLAVAFDQRLRQLGEARDELEDRVKERTEELEVALADLTVAKEQAEQSSRAKSDFLANMSHEIRTPMTAILGYGQLLGEEELDESTRETAIQSLVRNGEHLLGLINDILDISKVESGQLTLESIPYSLEELLRGVHDLLSHRAEEKGLALSLDCEFATEEFNQGDPTRVRQIVLNLIGNAIKFTERGGISVRARPTDRQTIRIDVEDTGIGISDSATSKLFQAFSQEDASTTRRFGGTGLGLCISRRLALLMGGDVTYARPDDGGSRFTVEIPHQPVAALEESRASTVEAVLTENPLDQSEVLLVEDGIDNQRLISLHVRRAGANVTIRDNGLEGLEEAWTAHTEGRPYDMVLMDMQMPVMSGYEAATELRARGYEGPILALTANAMVQDRQRCIEAGCTDFATKPIDRDGLIARIASLIQIES